MPMAPYVPPHLRAQRSAPRAALAGGDVEPSQGGVETKEIEEEEWPMSEITGATDKSCAG